MAELNNLETLTDQIYKEGVEKAEAKSKEIIQEAEKQKEESIKKAKEEADKIISEAKKEAERMNRSVINELQLKGNQIMNDFKVEITKLLSEKIVDKHVSEAFADTEFFKSLIKKSAEHWAKNDQLEVTLPQSIENDTRKALRNSIVESVPNLIINFNGKFENGFRIAKEGSSYQVSFSEEDFKRLFQAYLTEETIDVLFKKA
ncbi:MAG: V-type ATP synthase subunit E [Bacteroidota bacterium]